MAVLHDYECEACGLVFENILPFEQRETDCTCGGIAHRIVTPFKKHQVDIFQPDFYEELGDDCPYIESKRQLADECERRGLRSKALEQGYKSYRPERWV